MKRSIVIAAAVLATAAATLQARQEWQVVDSDWCDGRGSGDSERVCEVRMMTVAGTGSLEIEGGPNGSVRVEAWDGDQVEVRARVEARARSQSRAEEIAGDIEVELGGGRLGADGPRTQRRESWSVSYRVRLPRDTDLRVRTMNGGIDVTGVSGDLDVRTVNGGLTLADVAGEVHGRTTNGGVTVELADGGWDGVGLDVETTNGSVRLQVPEDLSADLHLETTNGRIDLGFPVTVQGRIGRSLDATLGDGGPPIRAVTTNGSVHVDNR